MNDKNVGLDDSDVPPPWSSRFEGYFGELKRWTLEAALPALSQGPLKTDPSVTSIPTELVRLEDDLRRARPIPIALVGLTGVGKSTLLNALLEQEFLPVGVIGSQTAAFVTISYAPQWEVTCAYIDESELQQMFEAAGSEIDELSETGSPEERERAEKKVRALLAIKDDDPLPPREHLRDGPPAEILAIIRIGEQRFSSGSDWQQQLTLHAKAKFWPITKTIDVRGPFGMLKSGVVISDLPGTGDLNRARANQAASAVNDAGQILIAADARLLQTSLMDQLEGEGRLPHRLFKAGEKLQLIIVGTSLDKGLPDPDDDPGQIEELGLNPIGATVQGIFGAVCSHWSRRVRSQFADWLRTKAVGFLPDLSESQRNDRVDSIMESVEVIPTSAKDWTRHQHHRKMKVCLTPEDTGLPALRHCIDQLAEHQISTTVDTLAKRISRLRESILASIERSESALGVDIAGILAAVNRSQEQMMEVQARQVQIVDDLRLSILDRFRQTRETITDKIQNAALKMRELGRTQVQTHLEDIHWASLRATLSREGIWKTRNGRIVNLRDAMGGEMTRLVPQAWSRIADERIGKLIEEAKGKILLILVNFTQNIQTVIREELTDELSQETVQNLLNSGLERAEVRIDTSARIVTDLLGQTNKTMQERVDHAVDQSLAGVCSKCSTDSGEGWKLRSVTKIIVGTTDTAAQVENRCLQIADEVFEGLDKSVVDFCKTAIAEMEKIGQNIPTVFKGAVERARLTSPQAQQDVLEDARARLPASPQIAGL